MKISELINSLLVIRQDAGDLEVCIVDPFALNGGELQFIEPLLAEEQDGTGYPSLLVICDSDTTKRLNQEYRQ